MPSIGSIQLNAPFCQAGLAGYSDRAMRLVARRRGCAYAVTESLLDTIMLNGGEGLRKSIDINDEDHPIAGQIIGSDPQQMAQAASLIYQAGYDVVDLNFACPVKKIKNKARGGHMLFDSTTGIEMLKAVRDAVPANIPTTISMRRAYDDSNASREKFFDVADAAWANGYSAIRVHARTVEQKYAGRATWDFLREVKSKYPDRTILGSGDVFTAENAVRMYRETGVDIVWIARGAIGNPWIFQHAQMLLNATSSPSMFPGESAGVRGSADGSKKEPLSLTLSPAFGGEGISPPTIHEQRDALAEHFALAMELHGEQLAGRRMRKMGIKYSRFHPQAGEVKMSFIETKSQRDWTNVLDRFYSADADGVWPDPSSADEVNDGQSPRGIQSCEPVTQ